MITIHPDYVVDQDQRPKAVLVPFDEWERIVEELDELDDIRAYDKVKAEGQDSIAFEDAIKEIENGKIA